MENNFLKFSVLHHEEEPLIIFNVWNVQSAKIFERSGAKAIATSSGAVAETLGYADGEQMSFEEYLFVIHGIARAVSIPFSVDLEAGYGESAEDVVHNIETLLKAGIAGVNIEDSIVRNGVRRLVDPDAFALRLGEITDRLRSARANIFLNVRCDAVLLAGESGLDEAKRRSSLYTNAGAHGVFFPGLSKLSDISELTHSTHLPINVIGTPKLSSFSELKEAGVKRISMGPFGNKFVYNNLEAAAKKIIHDQNLLPLF